MPAALKLGVATLFKVSKFQIWVRKLWQIEQNTVKGRKLEADGRMVLEIIFKGQSLRKYENPCNKLFYNILQKLDRRWWLISMLN